jgi:ATP-dependent RNA helicase DeaD
LAKQLKATGSSSPHRKEADKPPQTPPAFGGLPLSPVTLVALQRAGYERPTPVQAGLIPKALRGLDLMGQAQTGTGKTAAFAIPILERLEPHRAKAGPQAIVLVPTRELAVQVRDEFVKLAAGRRVHLVAVYGGKPVRKQSEQLRAGADVVIGTPGRVLDHLERATLSLAGIRVVVLDEADRMLDIGFRPDIEKILRRCPQPRQTLLLSATIPPPVQRLAERYMCQPELLDFSPKEIAVETIEQFYYTIDAENKFELLVALLAREKPQQAIVFCRTKRGTEKVYQRLSRKFDSVAAIHGDLAQRVRDRVMSRFREGKIRVLVATDVVGRGIDVTSISHIINYDVPQFCDDYVHRVGRTGRMGREGVAFTFVTPEEGPELTRIEMRINRLLQRKEVGELLPSLGPVGRVPQTAARSMSAVKPSDATPGVSSPPAFKPVFGRHVRRIRRAL